MYRAASSAVIGASAVPLSWASIVSRALLKNAFVNTPQVIRTDEERLLDRVVVIYHLVPKIHDVVAQVVSNNRLA